MADADQDQDRELFEAMLRWVIAHEEMEFFYSLYERAETGVEEAELVLDRAVIRATTTTKDET